MNFFVAAYPFVRARLEIRASDNRALSGHDPDKDGGWGGTFDSFLNRFIWGYRSPLLASRYSWHRFQLKRGSTIFVRAPVSL